jgi:hypothetical protein
MDDGEVLQVAEGAFSFGLSERSRKPRLGSAIHNLAVLASLLIGLVFTYVGVMMIISFFTENQGWVLLPIGLCFGGFGCLAIAVFPHNASVGLNSTAKVEGPHTIVESTKIWPFRFQRTIQREYPSCECRLTVIPIHNTKHDEHSFMLSLVHAPSSTEVELTSWLQPADINPSHESQVRRVAEETAQAIQAAGLVAEITFTEHWRTPSPKKT